MNSLKWNYLGCEGRSKMHTVGKHGCNPRNDEANTTTVPGSIACNLAGWTTTSSPTQVKAACAIATATCTQILRDHQVSSSVEQRFSIVHLMQFSSQGALQRHRTVIDYDPTECLFNHTYRLGTVNYTWMSEVEVFKSSISLLSSHIRPLILHPMLSSQKRMMWVVHNWEQTH